MINHPRRNRRAIAATAAVTHNHDKDYEDLLASVRQKFSMSDVVPLFRTDADDLFDTYINNLPAERQVHTCRCCRSFMKHFGGLAIVDKSGRLESPLWTNAVPDFYTPAMAALRRRVASAKVISPFFSEENTWGIPQTGDWSHFSVKAPKYARNPLKSPEQLMASKVEDFKTVARALSEFSPQMIREAIRVLESDSLSRSERFLEPARWLADVHAARANLRGNAKDNMLWAAVAVAPDGFCHPRSGVIGTLLEDVAAGLTFDKIKRRWEEKMHPLRYQRPQAAPSVGNIRAAEAAFEKLGLARSLERRFAQISEVEKIWRPSSKRQADDILRRTGVFSHLAPVSRVLNPIETNLPTQTMTWEKFSRVVLPEAESIEFEAPVHGCYAALVTAVHSDAPPIVKWDREDDRNPVSLYMYVTGSNASQWRVVPKWTKVTGIVNRPNMWGSNPQPHLGEGIVLILKGAVDTKIRQGNALFPEILRSEMHEFRSTIEAYSRTADIAGRSEATACGYAAVKGPMSLNLRVVSDGKRSTYFVDRWD